MRALIPFILLVPIATSSAAEEMGMQSAKKPRHPSSAWRSPAADVATRCPGMGGRLVSVGNVHYALVERYEPKRATLWCDEGEGHWRCRRVVVLDHELRTTRRRNPQAYVTAGELLRTITTAPSVRVGDELGALFAGAERRRTCVEQPGHGCAVQAARLEVAGPSGTPWSSGDCGSSRTPTGRCCSARIRRSAAATRSTPPAGWRCW